MLDDAESLEIPGRVPKEWPVTLPLLLDDGPATQDLIWGRLRVRIDEIRAEIRAEFHRYPRSWELLCVRRDLARLALILEHDVAAHQADPHAALAVTPDVMRLLVTHRDSVRYLAPNLAQHPACPPEWATAVVSTPTVLNEPFVERAAIAFVNNPATVDAVTEHLTRSWLLTPRTVTPAHHQNGYTLACLTLLERIHDAESLRTLATVVCNGTWRWTLDGDERFANGDNSGFIHTPAAGDSGTWLRDPIVYAIHAHPQLPADSVDMLAEWLTDSAAPTRSPTDPREHRWQHAVNALLSRPDLVISPPLGRLLLVHAATPPPLPQAA